MSEHLSDLQLDALRISRGHDVHLDSCPSCQARQTTLDTAAAKFAERFDPVGLAASALSQAETRKNRRYFVWLAPLAAAAAVMLVVSLPQSPELRSKGAGSLVELFVLEGETRLPMNEAVDPRARLAVQLSPSGARETRILWSSAPERWDALYPEQDARAWKIEGPTWLDRQVVLDGAPEDEELGVVACTAPVAHEEAIGMLETSARADCELARVKIRKR